ncbi:amino acid adenylation domain-containing protein [Pseudoalteromonas sp. SMS1]|uniref:non-ribosomal peptide synthetase n=1 Tax=Pseudoalteromonas sp. SMS1 TaxID=2908894 RepID=UPI001F37003A|nr:non-ribosomal peptide synthetase [Pseudoalteromonas sp. SMS1]MCF2859282.1 amino acid adenylation domain-containing protein [Pseudoalteromonas sp. SMS1]
MSEQKRRRRRERGGALTEEQQLKLKAKLADSQAKAQQNQLAVRQDRTAKVPLTPAQQRLWTAWQLDPQDSVYNLAGTLTFQGQLNKAWVRAGFAHLVAKHGILNSRFSEEAGTTVQQLQNDNAFTFIDIPTQSDVAQQAFEIADKPFDLTAEPLLRVALLEAQGECTLLVVMHHIVTDGTSMQQLFNEFIQAYALLQSQQDLPAIESKADYLDYALWLVKQDHSELLAKQLMGWQGALGDDFEPLRLPANSLARQGGNYPISTQSLTLPNVLWQQVQELTKQHQVTPYLVLLSAFQYLLHRYSDQNDVKVGVPIANRHHAQTHGLIGFFINTQVVRLEVAPEDCFASLLEKAKAFSQFAQANQDLPFEHLLDAIKPERSTGSHPLFQVMFNYLKRDKGAMDALQGVSLKDTQALRFSMPFDLQLDVIEEVTGDTTLHLYFANTLYSEAFAKHCLDELAALLSAVANHPQSPLQYLDWYPQQRQQCLEAFSKGAEAYPWQRSIADIISAQAKQTPQHSALIFAGEHLSYGEFEQRTNQLANWLIAQGVGAEDQIGVYFDRSFEMVIALIGVMKSGAAYVPLDPHLPADRVEYIAQNSTFKLVLGNRENSAFSVPYYVWSTLETALAEQNDGYPNVTILPAQAAYVIYTSGSTGKPKGVVNNHHALYNRISWQDQAYPIDATDRVLQKTPYGFDVSVWEFFWPLMRGATLVVAEPEIHKEPRDLAALIQAQQVTLLHFVPSMLQAFISEPLAQQCDSIKHIICSGEALPAALQADTLKLLPALEIHNLYGPTEAAIDVSYYECDGRTDKAVPIGKPLAGCELWVLDQQLNLSPIGAVGELYIGGIGLARGYANRPDLSAERFVANPFANDGSRLYRSGDLVRWSELGELEYLGRTDHQVKIRGLRIELGEIETQLFAQPGVKEAVVVAISGPNGGARLAAYVSGESLDESLLHQGLSDALPDYMVPSSIRVLDALPLSSNGKVDRKALPEPSLPNQTTYQAPQGEREELLCQAWQQVLGHSQIGRDDNFFALGGDSILSLQIVAAMRQHGFALSAKQVFEAPTIAQLASELSELSDADKIPQSVRGEVPLLPIQHTYFARQPKHVNHWNQAIRLTPPASIGLAALTESVQALIEHHDALRLQYQQQGEWLQSYRDYDEADYREVVWYQSTTEQAFDSYCLQLAEQAQASLNIMRGDSLRVVYVHSETRQQLLLIAHHLVIDGVSWRILVDDLLQGIAQSAAGKAVAFAAKSHSYQYWAQQLQTYPSAHEDEFAIWQSQHSDALDLPNFVADGEDTMDRAQTLNISLSESQTHSLLTQAQRPYRTHIDELLLAGLSVALKQWTGADDAQVFLEGHGREPWQSQLDLSRTLGWFTSLYPVKLVSFTDIAETIIDTKERLRALPNKGIGYGAFKYFGNETQKQALCSTRKPQIEFNYLGQLDANGNAQLAQWQMSTDGVGRSIAPENPLSADITINGGIQNGQLQLAVTYSSACLLQADMAEFGQLLERAFGDVIAHCLEAQFRLTPADVPLLALSQAELDALPISQQDVTSIYPLSPMQQGMMFHTMVEHSAAYLNQLRLDISGLDVARFKAAWQLVVDRHEALRSGFMSAAKQPLQYVVEGHQIVFTELDWQSEPAQSTHTLAKSLLDTGFAVTEQVGLMSFTLVQQATAQHHFIWTYHHMLLDGWSSTAVLAEVMAAYQAQTLPAPGGQFKDYLAYLANQDDAAGNSYWQSRLERLGDASYLTQLQVRERLDESQGYAQHTLQLSEQQAAQLQRFAQQQQLTVNTVLQGAWSLLLGRMLNKSAVCFGATTSGRPADLVGSDRTVGLFINTLPVISTLDDELTVGQWLKARQQDSMASREFEHTPLYQIQKLAEGQVEFNQQGLFDSLLIFENYPISETLGDSELGGARFNLVENREETNYPLTVFVETAQGLTINFAYQSWQLSAELVAQCANNLAFLLETVQTQVDQPLGQIQLLDKQAQAVLNQLGQGHSEALPDFDALALFEAQAQQSPHVIAVRNEQGESLNYEELNRRANQLAQVLIQAGVDIEMPVAVSMTRGLDMIVAMLAIGKAGGVYVPIALELPEARRDYIFEHSGATLVLTNTTATFGNSVTCLNVSQIALDNYSDSTPVKARHHAQLVYTLYTSGSTGLPKGVAISHGNLLNFLLGMQHQLGLPEAVNALALTSLSFDISGLEIYLPLISGGAVTVANDATTLTPELLAQQDLLQATPAGWRSLLALNLLTDVVGKLALCGGEALPAELVADLTATGVELWNMYGPTETTIWSSCYRVTQPPVHLGAATLNTQLYVLDNQLNLCPHGVAGELYIAGAGLARGYLARPELSAERFVANPFATDGSRLYRTGDLVRWNEHGQLEYLGRTDHQVKIRGYRIELGDIEAQLYRCDGVVEAVVVDDNSTGSTQLVGYVSGAALNGEELKNHIAQWLPDYMVPALVIALDDMPHNSNGKIDRKALPKPQWQADQAFEAPQTETELRLAAIWQSVLGAEKVGRGDNFFALGGDSIKALSVASQSQSNGLNFAIAQLFSTEDLAQLASLIDGNSATNRVALVRNADTYTGLSFAEQRQWFLWKLSPQSSAYHIKGALMLDGELNTHALQQALDYVKNSHYALRTVYVEDRDAQVSQYIATESACIYQEFDASEGAESRTWRANFVAQSFVLTEGNLFRVGLIKHSDTRHELVVVMHHIISDAWSLQIIINDFAKAYGQAQAGALRLSDTTKIRYSDYAQWQRAWLNDEVKAQQLAYWHSVIGDDLSALRLPSDLNSEQSTYQAITEQVELDSQLKAALVDFAKANNTSLFNVLMAALKVLLHRYSGQSTIRVGMPIANRHTAGTESLVGFFVNTQVITTQISGDTLLSEVLAQVKTHMLGAQAHQDLPFEQLLDSLDLDRDLAQPLFQVMINHQRVDGDALLTLPNLDVSPVTIDGSEAQFELVLNCYEDSHGLTNIEFEFAKERFSKARRVELASALSTLLTALVSAHAQRVADLQLLPDATQAQLHVLGQGQTHPAASLVTAQLGEIALQYPHHIALKFADTELNYQQLTAQSNRLAHYLCAQQHKVVAVRFERGTDMVVAALAVLKSGATYVPVDPSLPIERQQYIVQQSGASLVLSDDTSTQLQGTQVQRLEDDLVVDYPATSIKQVIQPQQLAYMIFTSGSTGRPKGVGVSHQALTDHCYAMQQTYQYQHHDHALLFASMGFDAALEQLLMPLLSGAQLSVVDPKALSPDALVEYAATAGVTVVDLPPAYLRHVSTLRSVRLCIVGGEGWHQGDFKLAQQSLPQAQFVNAYGPTEAVVTPTLWIGDAQSQVAGRYVPIGLPVGNRQVYVLDEALNLLPKGATGELYIGGSCLAEGYVGQPELTAERFVANPFGDQGGRLYRTGDLVRWNEDDQLEYLGRVDDQIKIRGHRIELGEIEAQLSALAGVQQAIVAVQNVKAQSVLVAYAVTELTAHDVQAQLRETLPEYMIPQAIEIMAQLPLNQNGKVDRKRLPEVDLADNASDYVAPQGELELQIAHVWQSLLQVEQVGRHDNFFALGGDSITALRLVPRINELGEYGIAVKDIFSAQDLAALAQCVSVSSQRVERLALTHVERTALMPVSPAQQSLWLTDRLSTSEADKAAYNIAGAVELTGELNVVALEQAFNALLKRHEVLRSRFVDVEGEPRVEVLDNATLKLTVEQVDNVLLAQHLRNEFEQQHFDLSTAPLMRAKVLQLGQQHYQLLVSMHHIISDGWSIANLVQELGVFYAEQLGDSSLVAQLRPLAVQYADYASWQTARLASPEGEQNQTFWQQQLQAAPPVSVLPLHLPRPDKPSSQGEQVVFDIAPQLTAQLHALSEAHNLSLFALLKASYMAFLSQQTGQQDLVVGTDLAGREEAALEPLIGFFIKVLPVRITLQADESFISLAQQVQQQLLAVQDHQLLTLESIAQVADAPRQNGVSPIFQQLFVMQNTPQPRWPVAGVEINELPSEGVTSKFDSAIFIEPTAQGLSGNMVFKRALYVKDKMQAMITEWLNLLATLASQPEQALPKPKRSGGMKKRKMAKFGKLKK